MEEKIKLIQKLLPEVMRFNFNHIDEQETALGFEVYNYEGDVILNCRQMFVVGFRVYLNINQISISALKKRLSDIRNYMKETERES